MNPGDGVSDEPARPPRVSWKARRRIGWAMILVAVLLVGTVGWVGVDALRARNELTVVKADIVLLRAQLTKGDFTAAVDTAKEIAAHAERAHSLTTGPHWWLASNTPGIGGSVTSVRGVALAADQLASDVLPGLIDAVKGLDSDSIRLTATSFDIDALSSLAAKLKPLVARAVAIRAAIHELPSKTWLQAVDEAREELDSSVAELVGALQDISESAQIAPLLMGKEGPQRYFVGFLNEAETRGLSGLPGAFGILVADKGKLSFSHFGSDNEMKGATAAVKFGPEYDSLYNDFNPDTQYLNSTVSPNFPYAAQIWASMWERKTGEKIDGALALDPTALSYLLQATGAASLSDGTSVSAKTVVSLTQSTAYQKFGTDQDARKAFLLEVAMAAEKKVFSGSGSFLGVIRAAAKAVGERRILMWSADPKIQAVLADGAIGGTVPKNAAPYGAISVNNFSANKLDYYLNTSLVWKREGCGDQRVVTATFTMTNNSPTSGLTQYVTGKPEGDPDAGEYTIQVDYFGSTGSVSTGVTLDGKKSPTTVGAELGHPVFRQLVTLAAGQTRTLVYELLEPKGTGAPVVRIQPMIRPMKLKVSDASC